MHELICACVLVDVRPGGVKMFACILHLAALLVGVEEGTLISHSDLAASGLLD